MIRLRSGYKRRQDGSQRPFGGVNVILSGDWWQIKPVGGNALFSNPLSAPSAVAGHGVELRWGAPPNAIRRCWELRSSKRCEDAWFNALLNQCRDGSLGADSYNFLHGFPTRGPAAMIDAGDVANAFAGVIFGACQ